MILVCDNYDSFTYNLVQYLGECCAEVSVFRNDAFVSASDVCSKYPDIKGIVISPGPGRPERAGLSNELVKYFGKTTPILGICLGHQCIGQVFGAEVQRGAKVFHGKTSLIEHDGRGVLEGTRNPLEAVRYHSLLLTRDTIPCSLTVTAQTAEGEIMGVRHRDYDIEGLQFHPESIFTDDGKRIIMNFVDKCYQRQAS